MKISVIIPSRLHINPNTYRRDLWLERSLHSARNQFLPVGVELEVVIGLDPGASLPAHFSDVTAINATRARKASALNAAVRASSGEMLAFLEDDDYWLRPRLAYGLRVLETFDVATSNQRVIVAADGSFIHIFEYPALSGWMLRRQTWDLLGPFDEDFRFNVESEYLGRMAAAQLRWIHLVEHSAPNRPEYQKLAPFSTIGRTDYREPLVVRTVVPGGVTRRAERARWAALESWLKFPEGKKGHFAAKTLVVTLHADCGFFSCFNAVINHLAHSLGEEGIDAVRVDWRWDASFHNLPFSPNRGQNLWEDFFEPLHFEFFPEATLIPPFYADASMTDIKAYSLYKKGHRWRQMYHDVFQRYIRIKPHILERVERIYQSQMHGSFCVGVHYRNPTHSTECPESMPSFKEYLDRARQLLPASGEARIFLATDFEEAVERFTEAFGERLVTQPNIARARKSTDPEIHFDRTRPNVCLGEEVLTDGLLLARCDVLLHVTSNLATAVGYINPQIPMVYCERRGIGPAPG